MTATTPDVLNMLKACRTAPDDDTARFVLADAVEESGYEQAAQYIRCSLRGQRISSGRETGYEHWLDSLLFRPETDKPEDLSQVTMLGKDRSVWRYLKREHRRAEFTIVRGLPSSVSITCPLLIEGASRAFLFPLTEIRLVGRRPEYHATYQEWIWQCAMWPSKFGTWEEDGEMIPEPLFKLMLPAQPTRTQVVGFETLGAAMLALNVAALTFGRAAVA